MTDYRISERARADIEEIYLFTAREFGSYQAEAYFAGLERTFDSRRFSADRPTS
jgi:toxin ParE1/3/4